MRTGGGGPDAQRHGGEFRLAIVVMYTGASTHDRVPTDYAIRMY